MAKREKGEQIHRFWHHTKKNMKWLRSKDISHKKPIETEAVYISLIEFLFSFYFESIECFAANVEFSDTVIFLGNLEILFSLAANNFE